MAVELCQITIPCPVEFQKAFLKLPNLISISYATTVVVLKYLASETTMNTYSSHFFFAVMGQVIYAVHVFPKLSGMMLMIPPVRVVCALEFGILIALPSPLVSCSGQYIPAFA
ncbi:hypothetical protein EV361DRAFT_871359 [Lentinula raphanica]|uniref:Uncharacterized protein n=1 Tax=Lentinula raphanica TaxID=153919 RepID=A0AA38P3W0_9AGAR|nr:hypothetical protein F5880DRAFT_1508654 [Lentinula raphanica]KAJ3835833.1 hypothetical protein F5878DRAFT_711830 [Lentinula raphanica]KAJ3967784.1 hypothetical protein EV361DRAFT_871359 [Lentinula raphanica]